MDTKHKEEFRQFYDKNDSGGSSRWLVMPSTVRAWIDTHFTPKSTKVQVSKEELYKIIQPKWEEIKKRYPNKLNVDGLEPALTADIAEIIEWYVTLTPTTLEKLWDNPDDEVYNKPFPQDKIEEIDVDDCYTIGEVARKVNEHTKAINKLNKR